MPALVAQVTRRVVRALAVWRGRRHEMEALGGGVWLVPSRSHPGWAHRVSLPERTCSCRDAAYHPEHRCIHRWCVEFELVLRQVLAELYPDLRDADDHPPNGHPGGFGRRPR